VFGKSIHGWPRVPLGTISVSLIGVGAPFGNTPELRGCKTGREWLDCGAAPPKAIMEDKASA